MGMNLMGLMKHVQAAQKRAEVAQKELSALEITGESAGGYVKFTCDGQGKFKSIKIAPEAINAENPSAVDSETIEMLEDLISAAITQANERASAEMGAKMKQITGGINIPGLSF
ncbi:YbaB/EbfC family nucleoid-associated protein [bacterium]|nr:YbaB/EbfC family nucleoid-associated protein [bacterium]